MEPVTHILTGAMLSRTGLNRRAAYMTAAMAIAAEFPDIDTLWSLRGPLDGFCHHRGITHTFAALPVEAALITGCFWFTHRFRKKPGRLQDGAPPNWLWLFLGCWIALLSHILLDWTNNYGVRPFFPFNPHWYAGSFVFIFEPVMFAILLLALLVPALAGLIGGEIGVRRPAFRGRVSALLGCAGVAALYCFRYNERDAALLLAQANAPAGTTRVFASPHMLDPFTWSTVAATPELYQLGTADTRNGGTMRPPAPEDTLVKPPSSPALELAKRSELGRIYLDWSMFPVLSQETINENNRTLTRVRFADARFLYDSVLFNGRADPPISGYVDLDLQAPSGKQVQEIVFDSKDQKLR